MRINYTELFLDKMILFLVCLLALLPNPRLPLIPGGIQIAFPLELMLCFLLLLRFFFQSKPLKIRPFFLFSSILIIYVGMASINKDVSFFDIKWHVINYVPFFLGCLFLATRTTTNSIYALRNIVFCLAISAIWHLYVYFFNPALFISCARDQADAKMLVEWGRIPWLGTYKVFFVLVYWIIGDYKKYAKLFLYICSISIAGASLVGFSRTIMGGLLLSFFLIAFTRAKTRHNRRLLQAIVIAVTIFFAINFLRSHNDKIDFMIESRIATSFETGELPEEHLETRQNLYEQYWQKLTRGGVIIWGQGLGISYTNSQYKGEYWSDVTLISFALTFGIFGILVFFYMVKVIWKMVDDIKDESRAGVRKGLKIIIFVSLLVSLNDNIWAVKAFVYFLAYTVQMLYCEEKYKLA